MYMYIHTEPIYMYVSLQYILFQRLDSKEIFLAHYSHS